jgi:ABC-type antimicrobial peptide transport system permease subunit
VQLALMVGFGVVAAILAALGVYGVVSYSVASRGRELGIRAALGATPVAIRKQVVGEGLLPVLAGLFLGLWASWPIGRAMSSALFHVRPTEPIAIAGAAAVLLIAAALACLGPARRASKTVIDLT